MMPYNIGAMQRRRAPPVAPGLRHEVLRVTNNIMLYNII